MAVHSATDDLYNAADDLIGRNLKAGRGDKAAFIDISGPTTYAQLDARVNQFANVLAAHNVRIEERVLMCLLDTIDWPTCFLGAIRAGAVPIPVNTRLTAEDYKFMLDDSRARVLVVSEVLLDAFLPHLSDHPFLDTIIVSGADGKGYALLKDELNGKSTNYQTAPTRASDMCFWLYTSGTTGRSKGAMLSHKNLLSNAQALTDLWEITHQDRLIHALPIFHTHGLFVATNIVLLSGGAMIFLPKLDIDRMIEWMPKATTMMGVPTFYTRLLDDERFTRDLAEHMRLFVSGSAPLLAETHERFEKRTGHRILERYGMTETNMNTSNPYEGERRAGTVGFPLPGVELKVCDPESGEEVPQDGIGGDGQHRGQGRETCEEGAQVLDGPEGPVERPMRRRDPCPARRHASYSPFTSCR